jgi:hypothetical protein
MSHYRNCMLPHEREELLILRKCMLDFLRELCRSAYVSYYNSNNLGVLLTALERDTIYPKEIFTLANYTNLCRCVRELCLRMVSKPFTEAFPTWQYSVREFRARINTTTVQTAGDGPTQSKSAMHDAMLARLKNIASCV